MCNNEDRCCNQCMAELLQVILLLQQNAECSDVCLDTCDKGFLCCGSTVCVCNTRPVMLYTCGSDGVAWRMPISKSPTEQVTSNVFRIEKLDHNCCTFRVLAPNTDEATNGIQPFIATNSFFTMSLNCLCVIRCLQDTCVECI